MERLQKHLARAGLGSRRYCETLIAERRVKVNGKIVDQPGHQVDPTNDRVEVDGNLVETEAAVYLLLNKPKGYVCSSRPQGDSRSVLELVRGKGGERLFSVGRLDEESQGALILTNDGEFSNRITHPRYGVEKTYLVCVKGKPEGGMLEKIRQGVHLAEGRTAPAKVHVVKRSRTYSLVKVSIHEGKNRHLRRIFAKVALPVTEIIRLQIGTLALGNLKPGQYRELKRSEIAMLLGAAADGERPDWKGKRTRGADAPRDASEPKATAAARPVRSNALRPAARGPRTAGPAAPKGRAPYDPRRPRGTGGTGRSGGTGRPGGGRRPRSDFDGGAEPEV
jgi:pseudouridine synthase